MLCDNNCFTEYLLRLSKIFRYESVNKSETGDQADRQPRLVPRFSPRTRERGRQIVRTALTTEPCNHDLFCGLTHRSLMPPPRNDADGDGYCTSALLPMVNL